MSNLTASAAHIQRTGVLLALSVGFEIGVITGLYKPSDAVYHTGHLLLITALVCSQIWAWRIQRHQVKQHWGLWFAVGTLSTLIGDYVNSAVSGVTPVSAKLSWALLWFGIGYTLYSVALLRHARATPIKAGVLLLIIALIGLFNSLAWFKDIAALVAFAPVLYYGTFIFNLTIYVAMPLGALLFYRNTGYSTGGLVVLIGALLVIFSDLILFAAWMPGNPDVASMLLYAANWVLYFGGQGLVSLFPVLAAEHDRAQQ